LLVVITGAANLMALGEEALLNARGDLFIVRPALVAEAVCLLGLSMAALAANGSLWYLLFRAEGLGLTQHPQLWFIPPAVCVLAAVHLNREYLSEAQAAVIRYLAATTIYVASTADVFLNGVAQAPWLPAVLGLFSILGVLAGILLRIRGFLYLGTAFLGLALLTVIWHAAVERHQTWVWWVCGIVSGAVLIAVFAVMEKKRDELLRVAEKLSEWNP
jgi:hypothetical protein